MTDRSRALSNQSDSPFKPEIRDRFPATRVETIQIAEGCTCGTTGRGYCPVHMLPCCREDNA
jgi:hypothetical protein